MSNFEVPGVTKSWELLMSFHHVSTDEKLQCDGEYFINAKK